MTDEIDEAHLRVLSLCRQGQYEEARAVCKQFGQLFPTEVKAIARLRAIVEDKAGNSAEAILLLQASIDETLGGIANQHFLLRIFFRLRVWEAAIDQASHILSASRRIDNDFFVSSAASIAAYCLVQEGRFEEARDFLRYCITSSDDERIPSSPLSSIGELREKLACP